MKALAKRALRQLGWELRRYSPPVDPLTADFPDLSDEERHIVRTVQPYTMTSVARLVNVIHAVQHVVRHRVSGDIVECGVWRGGCMMAAALTLRAFGDTSRRLHLYDTFAGMSEPSIRDCSFDGHAASDQLQQQARGTGIWCHADLEDVRQNLSSTGYPAELVSFHRGKVEETIPRELPGRIALLRLDTDWYESTRHELRHLYPLLRQWGVLIVDDYGHWQGARAALDEFLATLTLPTFLHRIDYTGRMLLKTEP